MHFKVNMTQINGTKKLTQNCVKTLVTNSTGYEDQFHTKFSKNISLTKWITKDIKNVYKIAKWRPLPMFCGEKKTCHFENNK